MRPDTHHAGTTSSEDRYARFTPHVIGSLIAASVAIGAAYAALGAGYVLDDWFTLGNAKVDGTLFTPGHLIFLNRPGAGVLYIIVFGVFGGHPLVGLAMLTALSAATGVLIFLIARRYLSTFRSASIAAIWVLFPNHTALEFWQSCVPLAAAVVLLLSGTLLIARAHPSRRQWVGAVVLFTVASLTYEAVFPAAVLAAFAAPGVAGRRWTVRGAVGLLLSLLPAATYLLLFRSTQKTVSQVASLDQMLPSHFGWGVVPVGLGSRILLGLVLSVVLIAVARLTFLGPRGDIAMGERLVACGLVVMIVGTVPFTFYLYAPYGAGDRFNLVSSIGGAIVWTGIGIILWRWRPVFIVAGVVVAVMLVSARAARVQRWTTAAGDSARIVSAVKARYPTVPPGYVVLGPAPVQERDIAAFLDQSNVLGMLRYIYGQDVRGGIAYSVADFMRFGPSERFDIWPLSRLEADVDLSSDHQGVPVTGGS